ncbi:MAG: ribonuclease HI family protein, partial [Phycisphaerae bacterium]
LGATLHIDGGSRGNPGVAGGGVVVRGDDGARLFEAAYFFGEHTNNVSEYMALLRGIEAVARFAVTGVTIHSDSELLVRQMTGEYRVKNPHLQQLHEQAQMLLIRISGWAFRHVRREQNARADELANLAMDKRRDVIVFDAKSGGENPEPAKPEPAAKAPGATRSEKPAEQHAPAGEAATIIQSVRAVSVKATSTAKTTCPAGGPCFSAVTIGATLPAGICAHAAHAILPTLLAIQNTEAGEFLAVPTLTVHCSRRGCSASFQLSPHSPTNGTAH